MSQNMPICKAAMRLRIEPALMRRFFHGSTNHQRNAKKRRPPPPNPAPQNLAPRKETTDMVTILSPKDTRYIPGISPAPTEPSPPASFRPAPPLPPRFGFRSEAVGSARNSESNARQQSAWSSPFTVPNESKVDRARPLLGGLSAFARARMASETDRPPVSKPSKASGGVPTPTQQYLQLASQPPLLLPQPRNLLVVIDLNGTLLFRPDRDRPTHFIPRPYAQSFISYCIQTFTVVVWSSARPHNVEYMCDQLLTDADRAGIVAIMARNTFGLSDSDYFKRVMCYKRLDKIWQNPVVAASHPRAAYGEGWNQSNTVLIDDTVEKALSEPYNLICVPSFEGDDSEAGPVLPQVHNYLNTCSQQFNVSAHIRSEPFALDPKFTL